MVELGDKVKDTVSGFNGIAVGKHIYLQGCVRITIQPPIDKEGKLPEANTFDEPLVIVLKPKYVVTKKKEKPGGPAKYKDEGRLVPKVKF